jgi:hypothetical protein
MRLVFCTCIALAALLAPAADAVPARRVEAGHGLSVVLPGGWRLSHARLSNCSDPVQRLVAKTEGALVLVQESWQGDFPARPAHLSLGPIVQVGGCCDMPDGRGSEVLFSDHGRRFYAFVYATAREQRRDALALLNSLRVTPEAVVGA